MEPGIAAHLPHLMERRSLLRLANALLLAPLAGCMHGPVNGGGPAPASYATAMRRAVASVAGELPDYQFRATPIGNFGVGSIYLDDIEGGKPAQAESGWFLGSPENWLAPSLASSDRQRWMARLVSEGSMGAVRLDGAGSREVHLQAGIALLSALAGEASFDAQNEMQARLQADELRQRRLNWAELQAALRDGQVSRDVAAVVQRGGFVVAAADVVLVGYRAEIAVDESRSPAIAARLRAKALLPARVGGSASLRVTEASRGRFVVTSAQPVVAAVLFKRPPPVAKDGSAPRDLAAWPKAAVSEQAIASVESRVLELRGGR